MNMVKDKVNLKNLKIDEDELKIILDEIERGCFKTQKEVFNEIYDRVIKPQTENQETFEKELREIYDDWKKAHFDFTPDYLTIRKFIKKILGDATE